jgi:hypothetical protein
VWATSRKTGLPDDQIAAQQNRASALHICLRAPRRNTLDLGEALARHTAGYMGTRQVLLGLVLLTSTA